MKGRDLEVPRLGAVDGARGLGEGISLRRTMVMVGLQVFSIRFLVYTEKIKLTQTIS